MTSPDNQSMIISRDGGCLVEEYGTRVSSYLELVSWVYLYPRVDIHSGTETDRRSLKTASCYPSSF